MNSAFGEMNVTDALQPCAARVRVDRRLLAEAESRDERLVDVDVRPGVIEVDDVTMGVRGARISPASASFWVTTPRDGRLDGGILDRLLQRGDLGVRGREPGARRLDFLRPGAVLQAQQALRGGPNALLGAGQPGPRHVAPAWPRRHAASASRSST